MQLRRARNRGRRVFEAQARVYFEASALQLVVLFLLFNFNKSKILF
jgi:hypothetical protein